MKGKRIKGTVIIKGKPIEVMYSFKKGDSSIIECVPLDGGEEFLTHYESLTLGS